MNEPQRRYTLSLTEQQASIINKALEFYERIGMGQLGEIIYLKLETKPGSIEQNDRDLAERMLDNVKHLLYGLERSSYHSIGSPKISDVFRIAYDLHQVIRYRLAWDRNPRKDIMNCHKDEPMRYGPEPLATIKEIKDVID